MSDTRPRCARDRGEDRYAAILTRGRELCRPRTVITIKKKPPTMPWPMSTKPRYHAKPRRRTRTRAERAIVRVRPFFLILSSPRRRRGGSIQGNERGPATPRRRRRSHLLSLSTAAQRDIERRRRALDARALDLGCDVTISILRRNMLTARRSSIYMTLPRCRVR